MSVVGGKLQYEGNQDSCGERKNQREQFWFKHSGRGCEVYAINDEEIGCLGIGSTEGKVYNKGDLEEYGV